MLRLLFGLVVWFGSEPVRTRTEPLPELDAYRTTISVPIRIRLQNLLSSKLKGQGKVSPLTYKYYIRNYAEKSTMAGAE